MLAHFSDADTIRQRLGGGQHLYLSAFQAGFHGRQTGGFDTDNTYFGTLGFNRRGDTSNQAATTDGYDDHVQFRDLFQQFKADSPLSGNHQRIVEGMDKRIAVLSL